jgi:hypothetical protein
VVILIGPGTEEGHTGDARWFCNRTRTETRFASEALSLSAGNTLDSLLLKRVIATITLIVGLRGRLRRARFRPAKVRADNGYDFRRCRRTLRQRAIAPRINRHGVESSERLGRYRWVVERSLAWLVGYRRLGTHDERRADWYSACFI